MAKKYQQSSGSSYSLLALLKRTLFLHETSSIEELVEEVHECMLKDHSYDQIKTDYVEPMLLHNPSFLKAGEGENFWRLSEGNKINDSVYEVFLKYRSPLSERQILNRLAKAEHLNKIIMVLDLKNDARFSDLTGGKYWILSEWVVINDYARSLLLRSKSGLTEKELLQKVVASYSVEREKAIFIPMLDERFVKKEKRWTLKRFVNQKTKLRSARIERLYQYLLKAGRALSDDELTSMVLNMPANTTDVNEKLTEDPRFVFEDGRWDLLARVEEREAALAVPEPEILQEQIVPPEPLPVPEGKAETEIETVPEEQASQIEEFHEEAETPLADSIELLSGHIGKETPETLREAEEAIPEEKELVEEAVLKEDAEEVEEERQEGQMDEYLENLRSKVVDFLQDAFHSEGVVYNVNIIDQFVNSDQKEELFRQFVLNHFANESKGRILTERDLIKFMVHLAEPALNDKILDPCCGTGGFLLQILETLDAQLQNADWMERESAIHYELQTGQFYFVQMSEEEREYFELPLDDAVARWLPIIRFCKQQQLTGVDIDPFAYRTTDVNIAIEGFPEIVLHRDDSLTSKQIGSGVYDIVLGNPPASGDSPTRFLRRSLVLTKPGGKILLLLPNLMFSDFQLLSASLRNQIAAQTIVRAVIRLPEPSDPNSYGLKQTLIFCLRKHHETEQQSDIFVGQIDHLDKLRELIEVIEYPDVPVSQSDIPIPGEMIFHILSLYQGNAYNLLVEGLRRRILQGNMMSVNEWVSVKRPEEAQE